MSFIDRKLVALAVAAAAASLTLVSSADARHHRRAPRVAATGPALVPAHERPGFVRATGIGLVDLGLGPVFPFGGWPKQL